jgi:hypothetical protein
MNKKEINELVDHPKTKIGKWSLEFTEQGAVAVLLTGIIPEGEDKGKLLILSSTSNIEFISLLFDAIINRIKEGRCKTDKSDFTYIW